MSLVKRLFSSRCQSRADDPNRVVLEFRVDDKDQAARDRANHDESIFEIGVVAVENFEEINARLKELPRLFEGNPILPLVGDVFGLVPIDRHFRSVSQ